MSEKLKMHQKQSGRDFAVTRSQKQLLNSQLGLLLQAYTIWISGDH